MASFNADWAVRPAELLKLNLEEKKIPIDDALPGKLGLTPEQLAQFWTGEYVIDIPLATKLAELVGYTPTFWIRLELIYGQDLIRLEKKKSHPSRTYKTTEKDFTRIANYIKLWLEEQSNPVTISYFLKKFTEEISDIGSCIEPSRVLLELLADDRSVVLTEDRRLVYRPWI
jgi:plasmid maintenance system antidote protein VapI